MAAWQKQGRFHRGEEGGLGAITVIRQRRRLSTADSCVLRAAITGYAAVSSAAAFFMVSARVV